MKEDRTNNIGIYVVVGIVIGLIILMQIFLIPKLLDYEVGDGISEEDQSIEYMDLSLLDIESKLRASRDKFKIMEEVKLDNGLDRLILQGSKEEDRIVLEVIGNKSLDRVASIYLITWNSEEDQEDASEIDTKYMLELLKITFPEFKNSTDWLEDSLRDLGTSKVVKVIDKSQIGLMSMDNFKTVGLSILPHVN